MNHVLKLILQNNYNTHNKLILKPHNLHSHGCKNKMYNLELLLANLLNQSKDSGHGKQSIRQHDGPDLLEFRTSRHVIRNTKAATVHVAI